MPICYFTNTSYNLKILKQHQTTTTIYDELTSLNRVQIHET